MRVEATALQAPLEKATKAPRPGLLFEDIFLEYLELTVGVKVKGWQGWDGEDGRHSSSKGGEVKLKLP